MSRLRRAALVVGLGLTVLSGLAGCQLRTEINLTVDEDGSGQLEVAVALDDDAVRLHPDLADDLAVDDLVATGWEVTGPAEEADGSTWIRARHDFGTPEEVSLLVEEVAGEDGPFRDFLVVREDAFAETRYRFSGVVDFTDGVQGALADPELADALDAEPVELLEERLGAAIDSLVRVQVAVRLPGDVDSNAPTRASNGAVWRPSVTEPEPVVLRASSTVNRSDRLVWLAVAGIAGFALMCFVAIRVVSWRRRRARATEGAGTVTGS